MPHLFLTSACSFASFHGVISWTWIWLYYIKILKSRASLVAQWLRIRLPMQGTRVRALVREDPTCHGATKPVCHNYWACALEPASHNYWAHAPRARAPQQEKPLQREACALQHRVACARRNYRKPVCSNEDPTQSKINTLKKKKIPKSKVDRGILKIFCLGSGTSCSSSCHAVSIRRNL